MLSLLRYKFHLLGLCSRQMDVPPSELVLHKDLCQDRALEIWVKIGLMFVLATKENHYFH